MDAKDLLLDSLDKRRSAYHEKLKCCRAELSEEAVHDLRTSIRRLLATLQVIAFFTSASRVKKVADQLKEQLDDSSDLRDFQVLADRVSEDINALPELEPFQTYLEKRAKRKERSLEKQVQDLKPNNADKRLLKIQAALEELPAVDLRDKLPQAVDEAYLTVVQRYGEIDPAQLVSIHHLRVAFKNFRYMVEATHPCLSDFPEAQLESMHDYQTKMGNIHDLQVLLETLTEFAVVSDAYDPRPVRRFYEKALAGAVEVFMKDKDDVMTFWRATPLVAFPWQGQPDRKEE